MSQKNYKRSWKNLLINKSYQLKFTLFMVGLSTLLMVGLGVWVMMVANETTAVSIASVRGTPCEAIPDLKPDDPSDDALLDDIPHDPVPPPSLAPTPAPPADVPMEIGADKTAPPDTADGSDEPVDDDADGEEGSRPRVVMTESTMEMVAPPPPQIIVPEDFGHKIVSRWACELGIAHDITDLEAGRRRILYVLIATGLLLVLGLAAYGIKMTHKVAGPLFKVGLYLAKMRDGRFDKVWNLRKGDQLVEFYDHFKSAHGGVVQMQKDDIAKLKAVIAAAEAAGAADDPNVGKLRDLVAAKEKSLE